MMFPLKSLLLKLTLLAGLGCGRIERYARAEARKLLLHRIVFPLPVEPPCKPPESKGRVMLHRFRSATRSWEPLTLAERHKLRVNDLVRLPIHGFALSMREPVFYTDDDNFIFWRVSGMGEADEDGIPQLIVKPVQWLSRGIH